MSAWDQRYAQLVAFKRRHGHCRVPGFWAEQEGLGNWVSLQRAWRAKGWLDPEREARLDALGFSWAVGDESWEQRRLELAAFVERYGHAEVTRGNSEPPGLSGWLNQQRQLFRVGRLDPFRAAALKLLGVVFAPREEAWDAHLRKLETFVREHGHPDVPPSVDAELASFVSHVRDALRRRALAPARRRQVMQLGLGEQAPVERSRSELAEKMLGQLRAFQAAHGHLRVPAYAPSTAKLYIWLNRARSRKRRGKLPADLQRELDALGVEWEPQEQGWESHFQELAAFHRAHGHVDGPFRTSHPALAAWTSKQRRYHARGKLGAEQVAKLRGLGFDFAHQRGESEAGEGVPARAAGAGLERRWTESFEAWKAWHAETVGAGAVSGRWVRGLTGSARCTAAGSSRATARNGSSGQGSCSSSARRNGSSSSSGWMRS